MKSSHAHAEQTYVHSHAGFADSHQDALLWQCSVRQEAITEPDFSWQGGDIDARETPAWSDPACGGSGGMPDDDADVDFHFTQR